MLVMRMMTWIRDVYQYIWNLYSRSVANFPNNSWSFEPARFLTLNYGSDILHTAGYSICNYLTLVGMYHKLAAQGDETNASAEFRWLKVIVRFADADKREHCVAQAWAVKLTIKRETLNAPVCNLEQLRVRAIESLMYSFRSYGLWKSARGLSMQRLVLQRVWDLIVLTNWQRSLYPCVEFDVHQGRRVSTVALFWTPN